MASPVVYRWDDANAPVARGGRTSLIEILTACLVDGYGDKPGAGWTRPYINTDGTVAAFRNNPTTGTGFWLRVDNTTSTNYAQVQGFEAMTSESAGLLPFVSTPLYMYMSTVSTTTPRPWVLIADDRLFHLIVWPGASVSGFAATTIGHGASAMVFGDGIPLQPSDGFFCLLFASAVVSPGRPHAYGCSWSSTTTSSFNAVARASNGISAITSCATIHGGGPYNISLNGTDVGLPRVQGNEVFSRPYVNDSAAHTMRGYVPGFWYPCHNRSGFTNLEHITTAGHDFLVLCWSSYDGMVAVDLSEHWRP